MKNEKEILRKLRGINNPDYLLDDFLNELQQIKETYIKDNDQIHAKKLWCYQTTVEIHKSFTNAFRLLKEKEYYPAWCQLERIEITFKGLKRHYPFDKTEYFLWHIERCVRNLQIIYPYRFFGSSELVKKKKKCSICDREISLRNPCGHVVGEIYNGEMCYRIVTEADVLGMAIVENPGNKYSVLFLKDPKTGKQKDQYNYVAIDYLLEHIDSPYEFWDLEISQRYRSHDQYKDVGRSDRCPCDSGKKYKNCCLNTQGVKYPHYEFILMDPSDKEMFINTIKNSGKQN